MGARCTDPHFEYKLEFLEQLRQYVFAELTAEPEAKFMFGGDFNIAPTDADVWDMSAFAGKTHVTPPERAAFAGLERTGAVEVTRQFTPNQWATTGTIRGDAFSKTRVCELTFSLPLQP